MSKKFIKFNTDDSVSKYFKEVRKSVILTPKEEVKLAKRIKKGDTRATNDLVKANLKFVIKIAKEYQGQGLPLSDLINEGNYGLIKAANRFDHKRGYRFISYAVWWVRQSILQSLNDNARIVRLPSNVIHKLSYLKKEVEKFELANEREPVFGEIFNKDKDVMKLLSFPKHTSLNDSINEDGDEFIEFIESEPEEEKLIVDERLSKELNNTLSILDERERTIVECYFGVNINTEPMCLSVIGEKYGISKERVRQIKDKALRKLKNNSFGLYKALNE